MIRRSLAVLATGFAFSVTASAQAPSYDGTYFVPGLNDGPSRFYQTVPALQARGLDLKAWWWLGLSTTATLATQAGELSSLRNSNLWFSDSTILVGHSMGGLTSRRSYLDTPAGVAGIVTVGTPHQGAPVTVGGRRFARYMGMVVARTARGFLGWLTFGAIAGPVARGTLQTAASDQGLLSTYVSNRIADQSGYSTPAAGDLRPTSTAIQQLGAARADGGLPRATVRGEIPYRNAVWYVLASAGLDQGRTANAYIGARTFVKSYAKTCKHVAYATIVFWAQGRECAKLDRAISQIDNEYLGAVNGRAPSGRPLLGAFDGFVPASHSVYPSTVPVQTFTAQGANHNNLTYALAGVAELDRALVAVGVKRIQ